MKICTTLTLFLFSVVFFACTKAKQPAPKGQGYNGPLLGKWYWVNLYGDIYLNNTLQASGNFLHEGMPVRDRFEFRSDGTMLLRDNTSNDPDSIYTFSYNGASQQIIVNRGNGQLHPYTIDTLTATKLVLTSQDHYTQNNGDERIITHYSCIKGQ